jgi:acetolactate synthase small subunit
VASTTDLGKWMLTNGGEYNPETAYEQLTMVMYENSTYITLKTVQGITPTDDHVNYQLMAKGFNPTALASVQATDTSGVLGEAGGTVSAQDLVDWVVDQAANKLLKLTDLVSVQTNDVTKGVSAALAYAMNQKIEQTNSNLEWKYVADVIGSSTINIPSDACEIFVTVTKSSVIYDGVTTLSLLVPVRILSTVYQDFLNGGYGNNDQQTYLAFFRINKYNAHLYALKVAGQDYTATSQLKMWYR